MIIYCTSASEPGSDMAGVNVACDDCDGLQNLTKNVCVEPSFISGFHNTVADVVWQTTKTTVGLVGCSMKNIYWLIQKSVQYSYILWKKTRLNSDDHQFHKYQHLSS